MTQFKFKLDKHSLLLLLFLVAVFIALPAPSYIFVESWLVGPITSLMILVLNIGAIIFVLMTHRHV